MLYRSHLIGERGSAPFGIIGLGLMLSLCITALIYSGEWMSGVKNDRANGRGHGISENQAQKVRPGKEFGSFVITLSL